MPARRTRNTRYRGLVRGSSRGGRDYFWAMPIQRVNRGGSNFGPFSVTRPGWTSLGTGSDTLSRNDRVNFSNGLSTIYGSMGATTFQREDVREADVRERPWHIHYFEGIIQLETHGTTTGLVALYCAMGPSTMIPREEGSGVPSGILAPDARRTKTVFMTMAGGDMVGRLADYRTSRLRINRRLEPDQDWLINFECAHAEGSGLTKVEDYQVMVFGRFRCSRS